MTKNNFAKCLFHFLYTLYIFSSFVLNNSVSHAKYRLQSRIVGGLQADPHQFSYQASLRTVQTSYLKVVNSFHYCGGALISDRYIVTAAHCTSGKNSNYDQRIIVLGAHHLKEDGVWYGFDTVINHDQYDRMFKNDISLIKTDRKVQFTSEIRSIGISSEQVGASGRALLSGWGYNKTGYHCNYLNYLNVDIVGNEQCIKSHLPKYAVRVQATQICTLGDHRTGTCLGDSGGALVDLKDRLLIGIIAWGVPCALGVPDQHTRISSYLNWIESNTGVIAT